MFYGKVADGFCKNEPSKLVGLGSDVNVVILIDPLLFDYLTL